MKKESRFKRRRRIEGKKHERAKKAILRLAKGGEKEMEKARRAAKG